VLLVLEQPVQLTQGPDAAVVLPRRFPARVAAFARLELPRPECRVKPAVPGVLGRQRFGLHGVIGHGVHSCRASARAVCQGFSRDARMESGWRKGRTVGAAASRSASGGRGRRWSPAPAVRSAPGRRGARRAWRPPCRRRGEPRPGQGGARACERGKPVDRARLRRVGDGRHRSRSGLRRARVPGCVDRRASPDRVSGGERCEERSAEAPPGSARSSRRRDEHGRRLMMPGACERHDEDAEEAVRPEASGPGVSRREAQRKGSPAPDEARPTGDPHPRSREGAASRKAKRRDEVEGAFREAVAGRRPTRPAPGGRRRKGGGASAGRGGNATEPLPSSRGRPDREGQRGSRGGDRTHNGSVMRRCPGSARLVQGCRAGRGRLPRRRSPPTPAGA
jgi:hypothetical protein